MPWNGPSVSSADEAKQKLLDEFRLKVGLATQVYEERLTQLLAEFEHALDEFYRDDPPEKGKETMCQPTK